MGSVVDTSQPLLSILKNRSIDKSVEKVEMRVEEKDSNKDDEDEEDYDGLESRLIIRLHCKHG